MKTFLEPLQELKEFSEIKEKLSEKETSFNKSPIQITGCIDSQKCHIMSGLATDYLYRVIITYNELKAKEMYEDYKLYDKNVYLYPAKDIIFFSADVHGNAIIKERLAVLKRILEKEPTTIITTIDGVMDYILPLEFLKKRIITLEQGNIIDIEKLKESLVFLGYERSIQVESHGQFAVRGGIIDIYPLTEGCPYRIEFWDNEIDTIRSFDVESQRSIENVSKLCIYPASELILDKDKVAVGLHKIELEKKNYTVQLKKEKKLEAANRIEEIVSEFKDKIEFYSGSMGLEGYIKYFYEENVSFLEYFKPEETILFFDEPNRIAEKASATELEFRESMINRLEKGYILPGQMNILYSYKEITAISSSFLLLLMTTMESKITEFSPKLKYDFTVKSISPYHNSFELLVKDLLSWKEKGYRVLLLCVSRTRARRLSDDLREYGLSAFVSEDRNRIIQKGEIMLFYGNVHRGFEYPMIKFVVISESDIFGVQKKNRKKKQKYEGKKIQGFQDLNIGDYVVHENHGVGIYKGIEKIEVDKVAKDYMKIEYGGGGILYVLATGLEVIQKYAGSESKRPKLNKLNSVEWKNTKAKVKGAIKEIAKELVELYAIRQNKEGYQFSEDTVWQKEFEELFPYEETEDQLVAIEATKKDMESKKIMDRLICGDVGYGKTEIAIRAAFKAVIDGKQVAFLVPTTILAQQHYNTFIQRMKDFPVEIEMMSRFRTASQLKKIKEKLRKGNVDIVVGTHRILSKDVVFKDLGLLIVDEEQRFGVTHKEKMKQLKKDIDVLTLSATPIPRTLHMSLIGIRDMSVLEEPPVDRMPIQTYVLEHNEEIIREAIHRELVRGGQVYYVYNRVNNIEEITNTIAALVPEANIAFAHGQMSERELEHIMFDFINGELDVLIATTIIETGLDISNVNTMIIDDADKLGLSQLYQLRGRVGRSNRTAYAFLMYKRDKILKEVAEKRLQAIKEFTELGSGFKIAMRDLEIRGAGNLLGAKQHGHMEAVGYDLYCKMLNDAIRTMKGEREEEEFETMVDIDIDAYIPSSYIKSEYEKLDMYKRIAEIENEEEFMNIQEELVDRFGDLPAVVYNLVRIAYVKAIAHKVYLTQLLYKEDSIKLIMYEKAKVDVNKIPELVQKYNKQLKFAAKTSPYFFYQFAQKDKKGTKIDINILFERINSLLGDINWLLG